MFTSMRVIVNETPVASDRATIEDKLRLKLGSHVQDLRAVSVAVDAEAGGHRVCITTTLADGRHRDHSSWHRDRDQAINLALSQLRRGLIRQPKQVRSGRREQLR